MVFTGSLHYAPNTEAMLYFTSEIWPKVRRLIPEATLSMVGGHPPVNIRRLAHLPNVTVTGYVPDIRPYIAGAQIVIVPLRIGGGTRLKIVEALAMGKAVVTTSLGCEGLEVQNNRHLLIADDPNEFADRVIDLLRSPQRCRELGTEGRRLVEEMYDWQAIGARLESALRDLVSKEHTERGAALPDGG
jgi:glycosyltransferase involved in cell wall biosynthesis